MYVGILYCTYIIRYNSIFIIYIYRICMYEFYAVFNSWSSSSLQIPLYCSRPIIAFTSKDIRFVIIYTQETYLSLIFFLFFTVFIPIYYVRAIYIQSDSLSTCVVHPETLSYLFEFRSVLLIYILYYPNYLRPARFRIFYSFFFFKVI